MRLEQTAMMTIKKFYSTQFILLALLSGVTPAWAQYGISSAWAQNKETDKPIALDSVIAPRSLKLDEPAASKTVVVDTETKARTSGYVAKNESIQSLFNALSSETKKPFILSKLAQKKTITGDFDISNPYKFLDKFCAQVGLAWYDDGQTIYVYDNSELKNSVVIMRNSSLATLNDFLQRTGLYSKRYPIRGEQKTGAFYISGPPVYVDLVVNTAAYLDDLYKNVDLNKQQIRVIKLHHTFVGDRTFMIRDQEVKIGGISKVIEAILGNEFKELVSIKQEPSAMAAVNREMAQSVGSLGTMGVTKGYPSQQQPASPQEKQVVNEKSQIKVIAYPDTNSLLVKGTQEQVHLIETLVAQLDIPKRHIELSLWVIDINKNDLDQLGIDWSGAINIGGRGRVAFNASNTIPASASTLNANSFLADITALNQQGMAQVVTRPIILTQDNVPAVFDNNETFYTKLTGERVASLQNITYGQLINVLPRYSTAGEDVEMVLDIEDGQQNQSGLGTESDVDGLPVVSRTKISTVARVPKGKSLLIGGFTRDEYSKNNRKIPLLGDIPWIGGAFRFNADTTKKRVRVYLIQPKLLDLASIWDAQGFTEPPMLAPDDSPLEETVRKLNRYPGAYDGRQD